MPMKVELGSMVKVKDVSCLTSDQLGLCQEDFDELIIKAGIEELCIVFDINEENEDLVDIVFEDGLEVFGISTSHLKLVEDDDDDFCPRLSYE
jgi:hypothetical protein